MKLEQGIKQGYTGTYNKVAIIDLHPYSIALFPTEKFIEIETSFMGNGGLKRVEYIPFSVIYELIEEGVNEVTIYAANKHLLIEGDNKRYYHISTEYPSKFEVVKTRQYLEFEESTIGDIWEK